MSQLLFTASSQKQFGDWGVGIENDPDSGPEGLENPNNYKNDLRNTIKIPKHSEIAVVNCEINRDMCFDLNEEDRFYWWYGELLDPTLSQNQVGILPMPIQMSSIVDVDEDGKSNVDHLDYSCLASDRYAEIIQDACNACICIPEFYRGTTVTIDPASAGRKLQFTTTAHGAAKALTNGLGIPDYAPAGGARPVQSWVGLFQPNKEGINWDTEWTVNTNKGDLVGGQIFRHAADSSFDIEEDDSVGSGYTKLKGDWDDLCRVVCRTAPLSRTDGKCIFEVDGVLNGWECGLTRPQTAKTYRGSDEITRFAFTPGNGDPRGNDVLSNQCDYVVKYWDKDLAGTKKIHVYQLVRETTSDLDDELPEGYSFMREVIYWGSEEGGRPKNQITETDMVSQGKKYKFLQFNLKGNALQIGMSATVGGAYDIVTTTFTQDGTTVQHTLPTGMNSMALYPLVSIPNDGGAIRIKQYDVNDDSKVHINWSVPYPDSTSFNYPLDKVDRCNTEALTGIADTEEVDDDGNAIRPWLGGSSFYGWGVSTADEGYTEDWGCAGVVAWRYEFLRSRDYKQNGMNGSAAPTYPCRYKLLDANNECPDLEHGILTQKGEWDEENGFDAPGVYSTDVGDMGVNEPPNMARKLGVFYRNLYQTIDGESQSITKVPGANHRARWVVNGADEFGDEPDLMLIEVLPFNQESYNMSASVPSKMVYVVPKSDHRGKLDGKMFHEAKDRYYVSLNNPNDIYINHLEVRFTDKSGQTTTDLTGASAVTFHIQPERGRMLS